MPLTARENRLRDIARRLIESDQLPAVEPSSLSGGFGDGKPCSPCTLPIGNTEVEYELESAGKGYHFHFMCHAAWAFEFARAAYLHQLSTDRSDDG
jgi:hypothetical protein